MTHETTKRLVARVKQIRLARGLTQEQFAELADLDPKYYQHVEAGRKPNPEMETLLKLAKGCGLKLYKLLDFDNPAIALAEEQAKYDGQASRAKNTPKSPKRRSDAKGT